VDQCATTGGKNVILIDDVLYTGRTIMHHYMLLLDFGRPEKVELCVLIDRRFSSQLPIHPDDTGKRMTQSFLKR
jgi:pyrimidine operon attenuation protein/uracil phosphoribosyltransferase